MSYRPIIYWNANFTCKTVQNKISDINNMQNIDSMFPKLKLHFKDLNLIHVI